jgi:hypothetical protein
MVSVTDSYGRILGYLDRSRYFFFQVWGVPTKCTRLKMVWTLLTRSVNTQVALCEACGEALDVTGRLFIATAGRLVVEVGWRHCCLETAGSVLALYWGSLGEACCSVKPDEAGELFWLVSIKVFSDLLLSVVTLWRTERATRTALLECTC